MASTFHGLEVAKRGMMTQQAALYTTGHNISNANTPGYTRQRVNFEQTDPYPSASMNRPQIPGQMGTGVKAGSIQRIRDSFIDDQYRGENNKLGYWEARSQALSSMEAIMNEPSEQGLANTLDQFWTSLQDLSVSPQDSGARSVVKERGIAVASTFNYIYNSLQTVQKDYEAEIDVTQKSVNSILNQINQFNQLIADVEVHGYLPNDLYDQRDVLVDELSTYLNIIVDPQPSGGLANSIAEGKYDIYLADSNGNKLLDSTSQPIKLVNSADRKAYGVYVKFDTTTSDKPVETLQFLELDPAGEGFDGFVNDPTADTPSVDYEFANFKDFADHTTGSLKAHIETYGYKDGAKTKGLYPDMLSNLDEMAFRFAEKFNEVHRSGWSITEINSGVNDNIDFFTYNNAALTTPPITDITGAAKYLRVSDPILASTNNIAAAQANSDSGLAFVGNGSNALALANVKDEELTYGTSSTTVTSFYQSVIGDMGVKSSESNRMAKNSEVLKNSALTRRESVSSVSLDEEMTNMIKFQHAYNAAARTITMVDEMLDKIINGMGVVGR